MEIWRKKYSMRVLLGKQALARGGGRERGVRIGACSKLVSAFSNITSNSDVPVFSRTSAGGYKGALGCLISQNSTRMLGMTNQHRMLPSRVHTLLYLNAMPHIKYNFFNLNETVSYSADSTMSKTTAHK
jgi:hypothetical protein